MDILIMQLTTLTAAQSVIRRTLASEVEMARSFGATALLSTSLTVATVAASVAVATAPANATPTARTYPVPGGVAPDPSPSVVGPIAPPTTSRSLREVQKVFLTMKKTVYSHKYVENTQTGYYAWDCVGMTDWILHRAAPKAWTAMHTALKTRPGFVPTPTKWAGYLQGSQGRVSKNWKVTTKISKLRPGDYLIFPQNTADKFVGHAVIAAGPPVQMSDGSYALSVYDSTGSAHGPFDTRYVDKRTAKQANRTNGSGLGNGTIRIMVDSSGTMTGAKWSINAGGPTMRNIPVVAARALR